MPRLLDTLIQRKLWVVSLANAIGLSYTEAVDIINGQRMPDDATRRNLSRVLGGDWSGDIASPGEIIPDNLLQQDIVVEDPGIQLPRSASAVVVVRAWLDQYQVFTLPAYLAALDRHGYKGVGTRNGGLPFTRLGYYAKREYHRGKQRYVWRFNPFRFGLKSEDPLEGVTSFDDVEERDPRYVLNKSWQTNVIHFLDANPKFTLLAISHALGVDNLAALRKQLKMRRYKSVKGIWQAMGPDERRIPAGELRLKRKTRMRISPTGYILTKRDDRGVVVMLHGGGYEIIDLAYMGAVRPRVFRSERQARAAHPGHEIRKWTRDDANRSQGCEQGCEPTDTGSSDVDVGSGI